MVGLYENNDTDRPIRHIRHMPIISDDTWHDVHQLLALCEEERNYTATSAQFVKSAIFLCITATLLLNSFFPKNLFHHVVH